MNDLQDKAKKSLRVLLGESVKDVHLIEWDLAQVRDYDAEIEKGINRAINEGLSLEEEGEVVEKIIHDFKWTDAFKFKQNGNEFWMSLNNAAKVNYEEAYELIPPIYGGRKYRQKSEIEYEVDSNVINIEINDVIVEMDEELEMLSQKYLNDRDRVLINVSKKMKSKKTEKMEQGGTTNVTDSTDIMDLFAMVKERIPNMKMKYGIDKIKITLNDEVLVDSGGPDREHLVGLYLGGVLQGCNECSNKKENGGEIPDTFSEFHEQTKEELENLLESNYASPSKIADWMEEKLNTAHLFGFRECQNGSKD